MKNFFNLYTFIFLLIFTQSSLQHKKGHLQYLQQVPLSTLTVVNLPGEIFELKAELNNEKKEKRKEAVKKVIAAMTVGKDVR